MRKTGENHPRNHPQNDACEEWFARNPGRFDPDMDAAFAAQNPASYQPDYLLPRKSASSQRRSPIALVRKPAASCLPRHKPDTLKTA